LPMIRIINSTVYINPGSVGQPRDGNWEASYAIIDTYDKSFKIKRKRYDIEKTIEKINVLNMDDKIKDTLIKILKNGGIS